MREKNVLNIIGSLSQKYFFGFKYLNSNSNSKCYSLNCLSCMFAVDEKLNASCNLTKFRFPRAWSTAALNAQD